VAGDAEGEPGELRLPLRRRRQGCPCEPDEKLRPGVEPERRVARDEAEPDDAAPLARHDRLLQDDEVACRPERDEGVGPRGDAVAVYRQALHAGAAETARRHVDAVGVDEAAGE
jgi:hypothetical protein